MIIVNDIYNRYKYIYFNINIILYIEKVWCKHHYYEIEYYIDIHNIYISK